MATFWRSTAILAGSTAVSQIILFAASPVISRLYTPKEYGELGVVISVTALLAVVVGLRLEMAIPLAEEENEANQLLWVCLQTSVVLTALISCLGLGILWLMPQSTFGDTLVANVPWIILGVLCINWFHALNYWGNRSSQFSLVAATRSSRSILQVAAQLALGLSNSPAGLVVGYVGGYFGSLWFLLCRITFSRLSLTQTLGLIRKYRQFPSFTMPASFVSTLGLQIPTILLLHFSKDAAGSFAFVVSTLSLPIALVGNAISDVFYPRASRQKQAGLELRPLFERLVCVLSLINLPIFAAVGLYGKQIYMLVFGPNWGEAGSFAQILAIWMVLSSISSPLSTLSLVAQRNKTSLLITLYETILRSLGLVVGIYFSSVYLAVGLYAVAGVIIVILYLRWLFGLTGSNLPGFIRSHNGFYGSFLAILMLLIAARISLPPQAGLAITVVSLGAWFGYWALQLRRAA